MLLGHQARDTWAQEVVVDCEEAVNGLESMGSSGTLPGVDDATSRMKGT